MCFGARIVESCVVKLTAGVCVQCVGVNEGSPQRSGEPADAMLHSPPAPTNLIVLKNSSTSWVAPLPVYLFRFSATSLVLGFFSKKTKPQYPTSLCASHAMFRVNLHAIPSKDETLLSCFFSLPSRAVGTRTVGTRTVHVARASTTERGLSRNTFGDRGVRNRPLRRCGVVRGFVSTTHIRISHS